MSTAVEPKTFSSYFMTHASKISALLEYANSLITIGNTRNFFKDIKPDILLIYLTYLTMSFSTNSDLGLSTILLVAVLLAFALDQKTARMTKFTNPLCILFLFVVPYVSNYAHNLQYYIPQLVLITTGNTKIAVFFQFLAFISTFFLRREECSIKNFQFSLTCFMLLFLIRKLIQNKSIEAENCRALNDSLKAQVQSLESKILENANFHRKFILSLSNEFRNPLNNIMGNIELILKKTTETGDSNNELKMARLGCETLLNFLNNILDFSKAENNELDIHYISCNIRKCLEKSWMLFREILKQKNLKGELYLHKNTPTLLMIDPSRLHQILLNLVQNSVKLTQKGFVRIIVSWHAINSDQQDSFDIRHPSRTTSYQDRSPTGLKSRNSFDFSPQRFETGSNLVSEDSSSNIELSDTITFSPSMNYFQLDMKTNRFPKGHHQKIYNPDDQPFGILKIQVIDSGTGIPSSVLPTLFQKFSKFQPEPNQRVEGGGVSLWITRKLCQKMEGDIKVFSESQKGSTFLIFVKAEISPQSIGTPTPSPFIQDKRRPNLLSMRNMKYLAPPKKEEVINNSSAELKKEDDFRLKAMVVDDIPYNQQLNKQFLEVCGAEVKYVASNGFEAYEELSRYTKPQFDLIFMDIDMPVMDGKICSAKIREFEKANKLNPVIIVILTGNCTENELKECLDKRGSIRANYFYRKPMSLIDCQNLIRLIKRDKMKKKGNVIQTLTIFSNYTLIYEKNLFQQVLLENYLRVGQIKHKISNKTDIKKTFLANSENINAILYNCEDDENECINFATEIQAVIKTNNLRRIPLFGIIEKMDLAKTEVLKKAGFKDFLVKPFDYENVTKLLSYPMIQSSNR